MSPLAIWLIKTRNTWMCHPAKKSVDRLAAKAGSLRRCFLTTTGKPSIPMDSSSWSSLRSTVWILTRRLFSDQKADHEPTWRTKHGCGTMYRIRLYASTQFGQGETVQVCPQPKKGISPIEDGLVVEKANLKNMKVTWDHYSHPIPRWKKNHMFQTTTSGNVRHGVTAPQPWDVTWSAERWQWAFPEPAMVAGGIWGRKTWFFSFFFWRCTAKSR